MSKSKSYKRKERIETLRLLSKDELIELLLAKETMLEHAYSVARDTASRINYFYEDIIRLQRMLHNRIDPIYSPF